MKVYLKYRKEREEAARAVVIIMSPRQLEDEEDDLEEEGKVGQIKKPAAALILQDEFISMIDTHIGKDCSPLLDIIAWNIHRTTNDIITFTKN